MNAWEIIGIIFGYVFGGLLTIAMVDIGEGAWLAFWFWPLVVMVCAAEGIAKLFGRNQ